MLERNKNGVWRVIKPMKNVNKDYLEALLRYLNEIDNLFIQAKKKSEPEFIFTLLRLENFSVIYCDSFKNLKKTFDSFTNLKKYIKNDDTNLHIHLFLYGLIIEASDPYNIIANLLNILEDNPYKVENFADVKDSVTKRDSPQHPIDKANQLIKRAKKLRIKLSFYNEIFDNKLRNAVFHSDYSIDYPDIIIKKPLKKYSHAEWSRIINRALAYLESFIKVYYIHIANYDTPKLIKIRTDFITDDSLPDEVDARLIIRKDYGLIGFRDNYSSDDLKKIEPFWYARFFQYEKKYIEKRMVILPSDRIIFFNKIISKFPISFRPKLLKIANFLLDKF